MKTSVTWICLAAGLLAVAAQAETPDKGLLEAAEKGDAKAQHELSLFFTYHTDDRARAVEWLTKAADQGYVPAEYHFYFYSPDREKAAEMLMKAAEQGDADAQHELAHCYNTEPPFLFYVLDRLCNRGDEFEKDAEKSLMWMTKAAEQGYAQAQHELGLTYASHIEHEYSIKGVPKDDAKARKWFMKAAKQEHTGAQCELARIYFGGHGVPKNDGKGFEWLEKALELESFDAQKTLAAFLEDESIDDPQKEAKAVELLTKFSENKQRIVKVIGAEACLNKYYMRKGDYDNALKWCSKYVDYDETHYYMGMCYVKGKDVRDVAQAVECFKKVVKEDGLFSSFALTARYLLDLYRTTGTITPENFDGVNTNIFAWCREYAERGDPEAHVDLGICYVSPCVDIGTVLSWDERYRKSYEWFKKAAEQGHARAQCYHADTCSTGHYCVTRDFERGMGWLKKSAEQGCALAQHRLGSIYREGHWGMEKDTGKALEWFKKAAEQGNVYMQWYLGYIYEHGELDVEKDIAQAVKWYETAAAQGSGAARQSLEYLRRNIR